ncbi:hypothetical protein HN873_015387 [Arachis hypogaea]
MELFFRFHDGNCEITTYSRYGDLLYEWANGGDEDPSLKDGVYSAKRDETVPVLSADFMCAKGWRGKTRFNPSGIRTFIKEYEHAAPANLLGGKGTKVVLMLIYWETLYLLKILYK